MKNEFVPYEQALALKELGFDEPCIACYTPAYNWTTSDSPLIKGHFVNRFKEYFNSTLKQENVAAPLYQQAFRWFREKYRLDGKSKYFLNDWYCFIINDMKGKETSRRLFTEFSSYEEAELACLRKLIEIVKNKENENNNQ